MERFNILYNLKLFFISLLQLGIYYISFVVSIVLVVYIVMGLYFLFNQLT